MFNLLKKIFFNFNKKFKYSQAGQDLFAYELFGNKGSYIDIGAGMPKLYSNTYVLETSYDWNGYGIEYNYDRKKDWEKCPERKNKIYWEDATNFNYTKALIDNKISEVTYLSCDIDPQENTFIA